MTAGNLFILLSLAAAVFALLYLPPVWRARLTQGRAAPDTASVDAEADAAGVRVYYFFATHCGPCRTMTPVVDRVRSGHRNLVKIDVAEHSQLARDFGVAATPTFVSVEGGVIKQVKLGAMSEARLLSMLGKENA